MELLRIRKSLSFKKQVYSGALQVFCLLALALTAFENCKGVKQGRFFNDQAYHFQTLRVFNDIRSDGADTGEILETISHIEEGNAGSWFDAWEKTGDRIFQKAEGIIDPISRGQAYLRAHNYFRTAEFFLDPEDPKRPEAFDKQVRAFLLGLDSLSIKYERIHVPYGKYYLNAIYYPGPKGSDNKPLIVMVNGFDGTMEELYFDLVKSANERGFNVLTYEGPGQGSIIRNQNLPFNPEWEKPNTAVLDTFLTNHAKPGKMVLVGVSLGGYLASRTAAFEKRFDGLVAYDVMYDFGKVAENATPGIALWLEKHEFYGLIEILVKIKSSFSPTFSWGIKNGRWTLGTKTTNETLSAMRKFSLSDVADKIDQDVLIFAGAEDHFIPISQVDDFKKSLTNARSVKVITYDRESGGAEHCQLGAPTLWQADFFDWMKKFEEK
ncbi:alpha/beta fold hydrolase [Leptospira langatensis]|uniref:Alpha/beta fold hydrolase n=2 Tax=Leptospira langatensis TaxID=2484983 RepID=A0A5F1ZTV6_9LEPT|nr:alpha/beta fold hydrolase [Leptospira langatensis]TGL40278.1 alpha/beta fold hydrolase [Leptospira langatensis]